MYKQAYACIAHAEIHKKKRWLLVKAFWYNEERKNVCGLRIREIRQQQGLTIQKLSVMAQLAGYESITPSAISKVEHGIDRKSVV